VSLIRLTENTEQRKSEKMNKELEETVRKAANYSNEEKQKLTKHPYTKAPQVFLYKKVQ